MRSLPSIFGELRWSNGRCRIMISDESISFAPYRASIFVSRKSFQQLEGGERIG